MQLSLYIHSDGLQIHFLDYTLAVIELCSQLSSFL